MPTEIKIEGDSYVQDDFDVLLARLMVAKPKEIPNIAKELFDLGRFNCNCCDD